MSTIRIQIFIYSICFLSACAHYSKQEVDTAMEHFRPFTLQQLIAAWGVPSKQFEMDDRYYVEWHNEEQASQSSISVGSASGGRNWFGGIGMTFPIESENDVCIRQAQVDKTRTQVLELKWNGNSDFCGELLVKATLNSSSK